MLRRGFIRATALRSNAVLVVSFLFIGLCTSVCVMSSVMSRGGMGSDHG